MTILQQEIESLFASYPDVLFGFAAIDYSDYSSEYRSALVFAVPYGQQLSRQTYTEQAFEDGIRSARARLEGILRSEKKLMAVIRRELEEVENPSDHDAGVTPGKERRKLG